jgi:hypothetical protein
MRDAGGRDWSCIYSMRFEDMDRGTTTKFERGTVKRSRHKYV